jgi:hypothetical protein
LTRSQFIEDLRREFEVVCVMALVGEPALAFVRIDRALPVVGTDVTTRVAFKVPDPVVGRPQQYVEPPTHLRTGGQPNNAACQEIGGQLWKTWSLDTPWRPERHSAVQLVNTVLSVWDR